MNEKACWQYAIVGSSSRLILPENQPAVNKEARAADAARAGSLTLGFVA
jgi:hypothetical protein